MSGSRRPLTLARFAGVLAALAALLLATLIGALAVGGAHLSLAEMRGAVFGHEPGTPAVILLDLRLPRVLLAALAGAALAAAGAVFQAVLRNPLAEPYILGVSGGAALGAILAAAGAVDAFSGGLAARPLGAFAGALLTLVVLFRAAALRGRASSYSLILVGVVINSFFSALILFLVTVADFTRFQGVLFWLAGSLSSPPRGVLLLLAGALAAALAVLLPMAPSLNLLSQGEEAAANLGLDVDRVRLAAIGVASLLTAAVVSFSGLIGFVGLMVPHIVRLSLGPDHRLLVPASALSGAAFLVAADALARSVFAPTEIPVGIVTALCGGPFFLWLYRAQGGTSYFD
jgi:iron complex transport system permease protein